MLPKHEPHALRLAVVERGRVLDGCGPRRRPGRTARDRSARRALRRRARLVVSRTATEFGCRARRTRVVAVSATDIGVGVREPAGVGRRRSDAPRAGRDPRVRGIVLDDEIVLLLENPGAKRGRHVHAEARVLEVSVGARGAEVERGVLARRVAAELVREREVMRTARRVRGIGRRVGDGGLSSRGAASTFPASSPTTVASSPASGCGEGVPESATGTSVSSPTQPVSMAIATNENERAV